ncbi:MAG: hypothetical protein ACKVVT_19210 [Dehalococcoidia bacterium]
MTPTHADPQAGPRGLITGLIAGLGAWALIGLALVWARRALHSHS